MTSLRVEAVEVAERAGMHELSATVSVGRSRWHLSFRSSTGPFEPTADPFVPATLPAAMRHGLRLEIDAPVSHGMLVAASRVQDVLAAWWPSWSPVGIDAAEVVTPQADAPGTSSAGSVGAFFSGGVDSFHTLQRHREAVDVAVFVVGFDVPVDRPDARSLVVDGLRRATSSVGLPLIEVETDIRMLSDDLDVHWERQHGASLAAVAHLLAPTGLGSVLLPSTNALAFVEPYGSHPGLDPLWGSDRVAIVHDGAHANRFEKVGAISDWDVALKHLRVCWQLHEGEYNCGRCRKCVWTMAFLRAHGVLDRATTFPMPLDLDLLRSQPVRTAEHRHRLLQAIEAARHDPELVDALRASLDGAGDGAFRARRAGVAGRLRARARRSG